MSLLLWVGWFVLWLAAQWRAGRWTAKRTWRAGVALALGLLPIVAVLWPGEPTPVSGAPKLLMGLWAVAAAVVPLVFVSLARWRGPRLDQAMILASSGAIWVGGLVLFADALNIRLGGVSDDTTGAVVGLLTTVGYLGWLGTSRRKPPGDVSAH